MERPSQRARTIDGPRNFRDRVSTRIRPDSFRQINAGSNAARLAQGLSRFNQRLSRASGLFLDARAERQRERGILAAREAFREQEDLRGTGDLGGNRHFRAGLQVEAGRLAGGKFRSFLQERLGAAFGSNQNNLLTPNVGTTLEEFDEVADKAFDDFVEQEFGGEEGLTDDIKTGLLPSAFAAVANSRTAFASRINDVLRQRETELLATTVFQDVSNGLAQGLTPEEIGEQFTQMLLEKSDLEETNRSGRINAVVSGVVTLADRRNDRSILKILDNIRVGPEGDANRPALSSVGRVAQLIEEAEKDILLDQERENRVFSRQEAEAQESARTEIFTGVVDVLRDPEVDPQDVDLSEFEDRMVQEAGVQPDVAVAKVEQLRQRFVDRRFNDDETVVRALGGRMVRKPGSVSKADINFAFEQGNLTLDTRNNLLDRLDRVQSRRGSAVTDNVHFKRGERQLNNLFPPRSTSRFRQGDQAKRHRLAINIFEAEFGAFLLSEEFEELSRQGREGRDEILERRKEFVEDAFAQALDRIPPLGSATSEGFPTLPLDEPNETGASSNTDTSLP